MMLELKSKSSDIVELDLNKWPSNTKNEQDYDDEEMEMRPSKSKSSRPFITIVD